jgi:hypothetical protein
MSPLIAAILDGDILAVRRLCKSNPELIAVPSEAGTLPQRVARDKGRADIQVALIRANASRTGGSADYATLLINYIQELSQQHARAGWLDEVEFLIWQLISTDEALRDDPFGFTMLREEEADDLRFLSRRSGGWAIYTNEGPRFVAMEQWEGIFDEWRRKCV